MEPHESISYNENIANAFYYAGYIETWGRGIQKICNACTDLGAAKPRYELLGTGLRVHFAALKSALFNENETQEQGGNRLGENRMTIIRCLIQNPSISTRRLAELLGMSTTAMEKNIKWLKDNRIIRHIGPAKGGRWEVIRK